MLGFGIGICRMCHDLNRFEDGHYICLVCEGRACPRCGVMRMFCKCGDEAGEAR